MIFADFPDGTTIGFPDGTPDEEIDRVARAFSRARNVPTRSHIDTDDPTQAAVVAAVQDAADRIVAAILQPRQLVKDGIPENVYSISHGDVRHRE